MSAEKSLDQAVEKAGIQKEEDLVRNRHHRIRTRLYRQRR